MEAARAADRAVCPVVGSRHGGVCPARPSHAPLHAQKQVAGQFLQVHLVLRSEERRVGKECRSRWSPYH